MKHTGKEHVLHLKSYLEDKYKVNTDWEGKLYTGISLQWDYVKIMVQLSMPVYVQAALHSFQHQKKKTSTELNIHPDPAIFGNNNKMLNNKISAEE